MTEIFADILGLVAQHHRIALATIVASKGSVPRLPGSRMAVLPDGSTRATIGGGKFEDLVRQDALTLLRSNGKPLLREYAFVPEGPGSFGAVCGGVATVFLEVLGRKRPLVIAGAGHCGKALARVAAATGYDVVVVDDRNDLLDPREFPEGAQLVTVKPDYSDIPIPGPEAAVATITRGHLCDGLVLRALRGVPLFYLGMIGSKAKKLALFKQLREEGFTDEELARVHSPIGLEIGAETPEEIAISILAELIAIERRGEDARP
ncbi:MAG: XdhC family protein [Thermoanaerobaculia bacterium]|nr:XdhC family protein [Thermoanaerobaculia bacterium]